MKRDRAVIAQPDALGELREDSADGCLVSCSENHAKLSAARHEDASGYRLAFHRGAERDGARSIESGRTEAREGPARRSGIALRDDLAEPPARGEQDGLETLATSPHRREERDVSPDVDRRRIEGRQDPRSEARSCGAAERERADAAAPCGEDAFDRPSAGHRRGEDDGAVVVQRGRRVFAEAGQPADAGHGVTLARDGDEAAARRQEQPLVDATPCERREEDHVPARVHGCHDRHRLRAKPVEGAAPGRGIAGHGHAVQPRRRVAGHRSGDRQREHAECRRDVCERNLADVHAREYRKTTEVSQ